MIWLIDDSMQSGWLCTVWIVMCGLEGSNVFFMVFMVMIVVCGLDDSDCGVWSGW